jgi:drug/metabolite transporter (DMT)-like permease
VNVLGFILALIGVLVIMEVWNGLILVESFIFGLGSALMVAISIFIRKKMYKKEKNSKLIQKENEGTFDSFLTWWTILTLVIFFLPFGATDFLRLTFMDILVCLLLGLIPTALGFITFNIGVKNDESGNIIILAYLEPFVATLNSVIFGQYFSIFTLLGGLLIIIANIIVLKYSK